MEDLLYCDVQPRETDYRNKIKKNRSEMYRLLTKLWDVGIALKRGLEKSGKKLFSPKGQLGHLTKLFLRNETYA